MTVASALGAAVAVVLVRVVRSAVAGGSGGRSASGGRPGVATGGVAVLGALFVTLFLAAPLEWSAVRIPIVALGAGALGALGDRRHWPTSGRLGVAVLAGAAVAAAGVRSASVGLPLVDTLVTVAWVAVVVEAVHLLDDSRGAAAAVLAPAAAGLAVLAGLTGQPALGVAAGGLAGALLGVVVAALRPPRVRLGESGATAAGVVVAAVAVAVEPERGPVTGLALVLVLLALPVLCGATVALGRLRHGRSPVERAGDGVVERCRARRVRSATALVVLAGAEALIAVAVVLVDRGRLAVPVGIALALGLAAGAVALVASGRVHDPATARRGRRPLVALAIGVPVLGVVLVGVPAVAMALAVRPAQAGADAVERGLAAARAADTDAARVAFEEAAAHFDRADARLHLPLADVGRIVPVLGPNLEGARVLSDLSAAVSSAGLDVVEAAPDDLRLSAGALPLDELRRTGPTLTRAVATLERGAERLAGTDRTYLLAPVREAVDEVDGRLAGNVDEAAQAAQAASLAPAILGGDEPRRYFVAMQNNTELRATGGFIGNYGELVVEDGRMRLEGIGRIDDLNRAGAAVRELDVSDEFRARYDRFELASTWQSINMTPDFPTVGRLVAQAYPQSGGSPVDGVIAVDPVGLAALLRLTGPVEVEGWPEPITADNVVEVTLDRAYEELDVEARHDFLARVAEAATSAVTSRDLGTPTELAGALGDAAEQGHLMVYLTRPEEQALVEELGIDWSVDEPRSDAILPVNQNTSANKVDYYLERTLAYDVRLDPRGDRFGVAGTLALTLANTAPAEGLAPYVAGNIGELEPGDNRTYLSLYTAVPARSASRDGQPLAVESERELGRSVYSTEVVIPPEASTTVALELAGEVAALPGGWYELRLDRQPLLRPDEVRAGITVADGWRVAEVEGPGIAPAGDDRAAVELTLDRPTTVRLRVEPTGS